MIIVSYQGPHFTNIRAVKLAPGLDPIAYIEGLPEGSCGLRVEMLEDLHLTNWSVLGKLYAALAEDPGRKFDSAGAVRAALFALLNKVAEPIMELPRPQTRYTPDSESMDGIGGTNGAGREARPARPRGPALQDHWSGKTTDVLVDEAKKMGYTDLPAPNGGLKRMRVLNWLRKHS